MLFSQATLAIIRKKARSVNPIFNFFWIFFGRWFHTRQKSLQILTCKVLYIVAETAGQLRFALFLQQLLQLLRPQTDEGALHPVPAAIAPVLHGTFLSISSWKSGITRRSRLRAEIPVLCQQLRHRAGGHDAALHLGDDILSGAGQQLDQIAAGRQHALVPVPPAPPAHRRRGSAPLSGNRRQDRRRSHRRAARCCPHTALSCQVLDNSQRPLTAHSAPHIQLAVRPFQAAPPQAHPTVPRTFPSLSETASTVPSGPPPLTWRVTEAPLPPSGHCPSWRPPPAAPVPVPP